MTQIMSLNIKSLLNNQTMSLNIKPLLHDSDDVDNYIEH